MIREANSGQQTPDRTNSAPVPEPPTQSFLLCNSDQATFRGNQWNELLELLGRKGFKKSKAEFCGTPGAVKIFLLRQTVDDIYLLDNNTDSQWNSTNTKDLYTLFVNSTQS